MSLLTRDERQKLIDLLLQLPNMSDADARRQLLAGLPTGLRNNVSGSGVPLTHITSIVDAAVEWGPLDDGAEALWVVLDNAIYPVRGARAARDLQSLLDTLKARAGAPVAPPGAPGGGIGIAPAGGDTAGPRPAGNQQSGAGTQWNPGDIGSGRDTFVGSTVNIHYNNPPAPVGGQSAPPAPAGGGASPAPAAGPRAAVKLDGPGRRQLHRALLGAYLKLDDLAQMVAFSFGENLGAVAGGDNISSVIFNLMQWAEARGRLGDLIAAAAEDRPQSQDLQAIARQFGLVPHSG